MINMEFFGTDGIRGIANIHPMTPEFSLRLGRAACRVMSQYSDKKLVLIGTDTRRSCKMLESSLLAGILSEGFNCALLGVIPTPGVAYLARTMDAAFGIMITASHNPYRDNGIKFFSHDGLKLKEEIEEEIEENIPKRGNDFYESSDSSKSTDIIPVGKLLTFYDGFPPVSIYINHLLNNYKGKEIDDHKIIIDCANGSASSIIRPIFDKVAPNCDILFDTPNGVNINRNCGSTKLSALSGFVKSNPGQTIGIAFDGDADRVLMVDEEGKIVDGDQIVAIIAKDMKAKGKLDTNRVVATVMSNLGFVKALEKENITLEITPVGDRHVLHRMKETGALLGGEQSGHIIMSNLNTTGDGIQTALAVLSIMSETGKQLRELTKVMEHYPQVLKNLQVKSTSGWTEDEDFQREIMTMEQELEGNGRLLIRPSGTEPLIRVMAEGKNLSLINDLVDRAMDRIDRQLNK
jgi:phosphoglucosamine mutase